MLLDTLPVPSPSAILLLLTFGTPSLLDIAKILGVPVALLLLSRFVTRRDKIRDDAATLLKTRTEAATAERVAKNRADQEQTSKAFGEMRIITDHLRLEIQTLRVEMARADMKAESTKETMARIDNQLSLLITTFRNRA